LGTKEFHYGNIAFANNANESRLGEAPLSLIGYLLKLVFFVVARWPMSYDLRVLITPVTANTCRWYICV